MSTSSLILGGAFAVAALAAVLAVAQGTGGATANAQGDQAKPQYIVLKVTADSTHAITPCFLCRLDGVDYSVAGVVQRGSYFNSLARLLVFAREQGISDCLSFDATKRITDGPGPFEDFASDQRVEALLQSTVFPDVYTVPEWPVYVSKMRRGGGAFVFRFPSGVAPDEAFILTTGRLVRDYERFVVEYGECMKKPFALWSADGKTLE